VGEQGGRSSRQRQFRCVSVPSSERLILVNVIQGLFLPNDGGFDRAQPDIANSTDADPGESV